MTNRFLFCLMALLSGLVPAAAQLPEDGPRAAALSFSTVAVEAPLGSVPNPAAFGSLRRAGAGFWVSQLYGMRDLTIGSASAALPTRYVNVHLVALAFGTGGYTESTYRLAAARAFRPGTTRALLAGIAVTLHSVSIDQYGSTLTPSLSAGWILPVTPALSLGFSAANVTNAAYKGGTEPIARSAHLGVAWQPATSMLVAASVYAESRQTISFRSGIEIHPVSPLALRFGISTEPARFSTGFGVDLGPIDADFAFVRHDPLGWTPSVGSTIRF